MNIIVTKLCFISQLMSGKAPARSCENVNEAVLNYSEIQALASAMNVLKKKSSWTAMSLVCAYLKENTTMLCTALKICSERSLTEGYQSQGKADMNTNRFAGSTCRKEKVFEHSDELTEKSTRLEQLYRELELGEFDEAIMNKSENGFRMLP